MRPSLISLPLIVIAYINAFPLIAQTSPEPCGEPNFTIEGKFINTSSTAPILEVSSLSGFDIKTGNKGEFSKYFEETMFGGNITGWLGIGTVQVTHIDPEKKQITFKVLEKKSEVTVNGKTQSHFIAGKIIKFDQISYQIIELQKLYHDNGDLKSDREYYLWKGNRRLDILPQRR